MSILPDWLEDLKRTLDPLMSPQTWAKVRGRCIASVYNEMNRHPEIALKDGPSTKIIRDRALPLLAALPAWSPERDRGAEGYRPYAKSRLRTATGLATAAKPSPPAAAPAAKPRRERPHRVTAAPAPAATAHDASPTSRASPTPRPAPTPAQPRRPRATAPSAAPSSAMSAPVK